MTEYPEVQLEDLNKRERRAVEAIQEAALRNANLGDEERGELKKFSMHRITLRLLSVVVEAGKKGDEGTLAAVWCRERGHFMVGPKGGIKSADLVSWKATRKGRRERAKKAGYRAVSKRDVKRHPLIYGFNL